MTNKDSESEKGVDEQLEQRNGSAGVTGKRQKVKAHSKKWWWVYLILFIAGVLIVTLPM